MGIVEEGLQVDMTIFRAVTAERFSVLGKQLEQTQVRGVFDDKS